jgi:hypothetical protein
MVLEASGNGYRTVSWRRWDKANKLIALYRMNLPAENVRAGLQLLADHLGAAFDRLSLLGFLLRRVLRLRRVPFNSREKLVCSEALALFLEKCGVPIVDVGVMSPQDAFALVDDRKDIFALVEASAAFPREAKQAAIRHSKRLLAVDPGALGNRDHPRPDEPADSSPAVRIPESSFGFEDPRTRPAE